MKLCGPWICGAASLRMSSSPELKRRHQHERDIGLGKRSIGLGLGKRSFVLHCLVHENSEIFCHMNVSLYPLGRPPSSSAGRIPTVDGHRGARHETRAVGAEPNHRFRNVVGEAQATHRHGG
jgi:hypothetical protein